MHETLRTALLGCNVILSDHDPGDGGFCIVPGSHKSNFKMPKGMVDGENYEEFIVQPATKAGDVILFFEGTVHGAKSWKSDRQRRTCLYRFSPATNVYGRSCKYWKDFLLLPQFNITCVLNNFVLRKDFGHEGGGWPTGIYDDLNEQQRAVLEPEACDLVGAGALVARPVAGAAATSS